MLRRLGASVFVTTQSGWGCPDLVVGVGGQTYLVELKSSRGRLNDMQKLKKDTWKGGEWIILRSTQDAREWMARISQHQLRSRGSRTVEVPVGSHTITYEKEGVLVLVGNGFPADCLVTLVGGEDGDIVVVRSQGAVPSYGVSLTSGSELELSAPHAMPHGSSVILYRVDGRWYKM